MQRLQRKGRNWKPPANAIYVGRSTRWGNPFKIEDHGREIAIANFRTYAQSKLVAEPDWLRPLIGKDLVCWCDEEETSCHANVLIELIEGMKK